MSNYPVTVSPDFAKRLSKVLTKCKDQVYGEGDGTWASFRATAFDYYRSSKDVTVLIPGKSEAVTSDVSEVIEADRAQLMDIFLSNEDTLTVFPKSGTSIAQANAIQNLVNYIINTENDKYGLMSDVLFDANLYRLGVAKVDYVCEKVTVNHHVNDVEPDEIEALAQDEKVTQIRALNDDDDIEFEDVEWSEIQERKRILIESVPLEDFIFNTTVASLNECDLIGERKLYSLSEFKQRFGEYDEDWIVTDEDFNSIDKRQRRDFVLNTDSVNQRKVIEVWHLFFRYDENGDKVDELYKVAIVAKGSEVTVLEKCLVNQHPYVTYTPTRLPHQVIGKSLAEDVIPIQAATTAIERAMFDNTTAVNTPRIWYREGQVDEKHITEADPNRPIPVEGENAIGMLDGTSQFLQPLTALLNLKQDQRTRRTGYNPEAQQVDPTDTDLSGRALSQVLTQNQLQFKDRARNFADSFWKEVISRVLDLAALCLTPLEQMQMAGSSVPLNLNANTWRDLYGIKAVVGLGTAEKRTQVESMQQMQGVLDRVIELQGGSLKGPLLNIHQYYALVKEMFTKMGIEGLDNFLTDPAKADPQALQQLLNPPPQPQEQDPTVQVANLQLQTAKMKAQVDMAQLEFEKTKFAVETQQDAAEKDRQFQMDQQQMQIDAGLRAQELEVELVKAQAALLNAQTNHDESIAKQEAIAGKEARENLKLSDERANATLDTDPLGESRIEDIGEPNELAQPSDDANGNGLDDHAEALIGQVLANGKTEEAE